MPRILTGVKPTSEPHIGNYMGAIRPALDMAQQDGNQGALFIADYHGLITMHDPKVMKELTYSVAATWMACGLDPSKTLIYKQSDVPEIFELNWILNCFTPKGLMNRAHAYKAMLQRNEEDGKKDLDSGVNMGLFSYPVLQAADILIYSADIVPVGEDQIQHIEIARDIAQKFNTTYKTEALRVPKFEVQKMKLLPGLDGQKMSSSYGNYIPMFAEEKKLRKTVMKVKTDSSPPEAPKDPNDSLVFDIFKQFGTADEVKALDARYREGISWGEAKQALFEKLNEILAPKRDHYKSLMEDKAQLDKILAEGRDQVREEAAKLLVELRKIIGVG